jgi:hypothetical protein
MRRGKWEEGIRRLSDFRRSMHSSVYCIDHRRGSKVAGVANYLKMRSSNVWQSERGGCRLFLPKMGGRE